MPEYNFLPNNKSEFPHIDNVNTYKYDNNFDYGRFDYTQMTLQICSVPWDMGEAHIGNRTISGIGNVVYFDTKEERDKWFADIPDSECYRFTTKFKELHRDLLIDVPIPYDMCAKHNYLVVHYEKFANENSPVQYEGNDGLRDWFWFIREVEFLAPNTTRLHLLDDAFQTWIYDVNVSGMVLERGHAPMFSISADDFLKSPIDNNDYLLIDDVNFGEANIVKNIDAVVFNSGNMYACIATTANPKGVWGSKANNDWCVPANSYNSNNGVPSVYVFAVPVLSLNTLLANIDSLVPQFKETLQGIFFASDDLITLNSTFTFADVTCYDILSSRKTLDFVELDKDLFGYPEEYENIAKLYTMPYAHIEITDESGNTDIVKVEDTTGTIEISAALSIAYPFVNIDTHLLGVGGKAQAAITFKNIDSHSFDIGGQWYETLHSWNIPTFAVVQQSSVNYDYSTHFDRVQRVNDYTTAQTNENANADTLLANADLVVAANTAITTRSNANANDLADNSADFNDNSADANSDYTDANATSTIAANEQQGAVAAASSIIGGALGALGSQSPAGAVGSALNGVVGGIATLASTNIGNALTAAQAGNSRVLNGQNASIANIKTSDDTWDNNSTASDITDINNNLKEGISANDAATQKANALRNANNSQAAINNDVNQAALGEPLQFGSFANGESAATKPMALFAHIVTQSKSAIRATGDEFLRYGYMFEGQWAFNGNWNIGKYFTYWKLKDFWVSNLNVPDMYMDKLRFFLFGGVTIWRKPEYIGNVSIYDNFNDEEQ